MYNNIYSFVNINFAEVTAGFFLKSFKIYYFFM